MNVALYVRVSSVEQAEHGYSIDEQTARLKAYCQAKDWGIYKIYTDPGFSGASMDRPGLQLMLGDISAGKINTVLVYKLDRLSRAQKDALYLIEDVFLKNDVNFVSISENFDTGTAFGRAMIGILAVFAQLEREQIKERMSLGKTARAKQGKWNGSLLTPVGYDYIPGVGLVINEYEAITVRRIYDLYTSGTALQEIYAILSREKAANRYGYYSFGELRRIVRNPIYTGNLRAKTGDIYKAKHDPIITQETFLKAQEITNRHHEIWESSVRGAKNEAMLSGIIYCGRCGARYHKYRYSKNYPFFYSCYSRSKKARNAVIDPNCKNKHWRMEELDDLIIGEIKKLSIDTTALDTQKKPENKNLERLKKQLSKLTAQRSKYMDLYSVDGISMDAVREKLEPLNAQIAGIESELKNKTPEEPQDFRPVIENAVSLIDLATPEQKRTIVLSLISRIVLDGDQIEIHWKFK